jgi:hypothetical protein
MGPYTQDEGARQNFDPLYSTASYSPRDESDVSELDLEGDSDLSLRVPAGVVGAFVCLGR